MRTASAGTAAAVAVLCLASMACGQKGPPLAPLHLVPAAVTELALRRIGDRAELKFVLPTGNANGPGRVDLDRVEIFAVTIAPGASAPPNRELMTKPYLVGHVAVRPEPLEGETPAQDDPRPSPGATVTFADELTAAKLTPAVTKEVPSKSGSGTVDPGTGRSAESGVPTIPNQPPIVDPLSPTPTPPVAAPAPPKDPVRIYVTRGVTRSGRPGPPSPRVQFPLVVLPPAPVDVTARFSETALVVEWKAPDETVAAYNVYRADVPMQPVNLAPVSATTFEQADPKFGAQQCFLVRSVTLVSSVAIEGEPSTPHCVTPHDTFPPAAPKGLVGVPTPGQISLIWDPNQEKDLAGYVVLRGEAPDGALQALTPAPIRETSYRDATVKPGVRYIYAIVAVDTATPANTSDQSPRVEETAR